MTPVASMSTTKLFKEVITQCTTTTLAPWKQIISEGQGGNQGCSMCEEGTPKLLIVSLGRIIENISSFQISNGAIIVISLATLIRHGISLAMLESALALIYWYSKFSVLMALDVYSSSGYCTRTHEYKIVAHDVNV